MNEQQQKSVSHTQVPQLFLPDIDDSKQIFGDISQRESIQSKSQHSEGQLEDHVVGGGGGSAHQRRRTARRRHLLDAVVDSNEFSLEEPAYLMVRANSLTP